MGVKYTCEVCSIKVPAFCTGKHITTMSKRINIILPDKTVAVLDRVASKGTRSRFIDRAVRHYVETQGRASLQEQLKAGYRANAASAPCYRWYPRKTLRCAGDRRTTANDSRGISG